MKSEMGNGDTGTAFGRAEFLPLSVSLKVGSIFYGRSTPKDRVCRVIILRYALNISVKEEYIH